MSATVAESAGPLIPVRPTLATLREAAAGCTACPLHANATQTVFGEGPATAGMLLVGEQPGDVEDQTGRPFVGPAGKLLDRALAAAGIERERAFVTNAVKHFKWVPRGKRRIHSKPNAAEIRACHPWLQAEIAVVRPKVIVCLGATAAQALLGRGFRVTQQRGTVLETDLAPAVVATIHPSALLRLETDEERRAGMERFTADLRVAAEALKRAG